MNFYQVHCCYILDSTFNSTRTFVASVFSKPTYPVLYTGLRFKTLPASPVLQYIIPHIKRRLKVKIKAVVRGLFGIAALYKPIVPSPLGLPSFTTTGAMYQSDTQRTLLAKAETNGIWPAISEFTKRAGFFNMPQS
jgi:hypothetical protein